MQNTKSALFKIAKSHWQVITLSLFFFSVYSFISIVKHQHYQTYTWDTGFFDQLIWKLSRFKPPISSFTDLHIFGDHFQFILLLLVPLYWLPKSIFLTFIAQALIAVISAIPVYLTSLKVNKDNIIALAITLTFLIFVPLQFAIFDGFHQSVFSVLFYSFAIFALVFKKNFLYWISIGGLLITKEEMAILSASIGLVAFMRGERQKGLITILASIIIFFTAIKLILPTVQGYYPHYGYGILGESPDQVLLNVIKNPILSIKVFFYPWIKSQTIFRTFFSFGFLPIFSPTFLIPALEQFIVRFLDTATFHRWSNLNHYAFPLSPIMAYAAIFGVKNLNLKFKSKLSNKLLTVYFIIFALVQTLLFYGPINSLLKHDFYVKKEWMKNNDQIIKFIPANVSVAATNNLGPHISQRDEFYLIEKDNHADFLVFDLENGPNKYSPLSYESTLEIFNKEIKGRKYRIYIQAGKTFLLKKLS